MWAGININTDNYIHLMISSIGGGPKRGGRTGEGRAVVAGGMGRHASRSFIGFQTLDGIAGSAKFERAGLLEILTFQVNLRAGFLIQAGAGEHGRAMNLAFNPFSRLENVWQFWNVHRFAAETNGCSNWRNEIRPTARA